MELTLGFPEMNMRIIQESICSTVVIRVRLDGTITGYSGRGAKDMCLWVAAAEKAALCSVESTLQSFVRQTLWKHVGVASLRRICSNVLVC